MIASFPFCPNSGTYSATGIYPGFCIILKRKALDHILIRYAVSNGAVLRPSCMVKSLRRVNGYPTLKKGFESSVPGLHFIGAPSAWSFGPLMRFVSGTWYTGGELTRRIAARVNQG